LVGDIGVIVGVEEPVVITSRGFKILDALECLAQNSQIYGQWALYISSSLSKFVLGS